MNRKNTCGNGPGAAADIVNNVDRIINHDNADLFCLLLELNDLYIIHNIFDKLMVNR